MRSRLCSLLVSSSLALAGAARAERLLTLDEALHLARQGNRDVAAARARLEQAGVGVAQAWVALLPTVGVQGRYTHNYKEVTLDLAAQSEGQALQGKFTADWFGDIYSKVGKAPSPAVTADLQALADYARAQQSTGPIVIQRREQLDGALSVTVPLVVPWAYPALDAAKRTLASSESTFDVSLAATLLVVAQTFYAAAGADELLVARQHAVGVAKKTLDNAQARFATGVVNRVEITRAELALVRAKQAVAEAADTQGQSYRALATLIQLREPFRVAPPEVAPGVAAPLDDLVGRALHLRPEFAQFARADEALAAQVRSSAWRWLPSLSAFGNVRLFNYPGFAGDNYAWAAGLQLDWLLYDGGQRDAQRHLAWAQRRENDARLALLRDLVTDDVANARRALDTRRRALDAARRSVDLSRETLDLVRVQHEAGTATQLDLLQAQDSLVAAEVAVAQARFDLALTDLTLQRNAGTFPGTR